MCSVSIGSWLALSKANTWSPPAAVTQGAVCVQTAPEAEERDKEHMRLG